MTKYLQNIISKSHGFALFLSLLTCFVISFLSCCFAPFEKWELSCYDFRLNLLGKNTELDSRIVIIGIDDKSIEVLKQFPLPRAIYGDLIENLSKFNPSSIGFDIIFDTPDKYNKDNDLKFAKKIKESGKCVLANKILKSSSSYIAQSEIKISNPLEEFVKSSQRIGYVNIDTDLDGIVRKVKLVSKNDNKLNLQFDLAVLSILERIKPDEIIVEKNKIILGKRVIPTNNNHEIYINYKTDSLLGSKTEYIDLEAVSLSDILLKINSLPENSIFLIGANYMECGDHMKTPVKEGNGIMYGIDIHSNILNTLLKENFISRAPKTINLFILLIIALTIAVILPRVNALKGSLITLIFFIFLTLTNFISFYNGLWLDYFAPAFFIFIYFALIQSNQFLRTHKLFQKFMPAEYVDEMLLKNTAKQRLGGEETVVTVLFSDIRGYTNLSEKTDPATVMKILNQYHTRMSSIFQENKGRVFDYQGDAQMVVFGSAKKVGNHALDGVKCAIAMQKALAELMTSWQIDGAQTFQVGIGLCTGKVALGLVGSEEHKQLAAIGDATNTAARLQGLSSQLNSPVIIHHTTYEKVKNEIPCEELEPVMLKGKQEPQRVFRVVLE